MNESFTKNSLQKIDCAGHVIIIPTDFQKLRSLPDDPSDSVAYGIQTEDSSCFLLIYPSQKTRAMPFDDVDSIAKEIHRNLGDKQGLIEISSLLDSEGRKCVYTVVKSLKQPSGVQYNLTLQIHYPDCVIHFQGFFDEGKMTGARDTMVYSLALQQGILQPGSFDGWSKDPYDESYKKGVPKNLSEDEAYDELFPNHPLSMLRRFVRTVLQLSVSDKESDGNHNWQPTDYVLDDSDKPVWD